MRRLPDIFLTILVCLICLVAGEWALRHWFPLNGVTIGSDPRYLFKNIPNSRQLITPLAGSAAPTVLLEINSQGHRGPAPSRRPGLRVTVYGDSFIAAEGTPWKETFVNQLEQLLAARLSRPVQVADAGVPGYGPDQESLVMEDDLRAAKPDLVIVAIYSANDFGDLMRNKLFRLDENGGLVSNHPTIDPVLDRGFDYALKQQPRFQTLARLRNVAGRIKRRLRGNRAAPRPKDVVINRELTGWVMERQQEYQTYVIEHDNQVHNLFFDTLDADFNLVPDSESSHYKTALMARIMERMQWIASSRSVPLVFLFIPNPIDVEDQWDLYADPTVFPRYQRTALTDALEAIAKEHSFSYLNLFEPFRRHRKDRLYPRGSFDDHWNPAGQRLAAGLMADYIAGHNLLSPAKSSQ